MPASKGVELSDVSTGLLMPQQPSVASGMAVVLLWYKVSDIFFKT
jgi:hypothetical protein